MPTYLIEAVHEIEAEDQTEAEECFYSLEPLDIDSEHIYSKITKIKEV